MTKLKERVVEIEIVDIDDKELERIREDFLDLMVDKFITWHAAREKDYQMDISSSNGGKDD